MSSEPDVCIGVLALQGSFREHVASFDKLPGISAVEVRNKKQLEGVDGLVIPGGESTTMALIAERFGLINDLRQYAKQGRPIWGTCAGLIFLANRAIGQKVGGQALMGGLDVLVSRNFFGAQIHSFEALLPAPACLQEPVLVDSAPTDSPPPTPAQPASAVSTPAAPSAVDSEPAASLNGDSADYRAVFIRAPAVMETGPSVEVLAEYVLSPLEREAQGGLERVAVAVRSKHLLATAFHPELTDDLRWHKMFVRDVRRAVQNIDRSDLQNIDSPPSDLAATRRCSSRPADLPIFRHNSQHL